jgi:hypothetical protein
MTNVDALIPTLLAGLGHCASYMGRGEVLAGEVRQDAEQMPGIMTQRRNGSVRGSLAVLRLPGSARVRRHHCPPAGGIVPALSFARRWRHAAGGVAGGAVDFAHHGPLQRESRGIDAGGLDE